MTRKGCLLHSRAGRHKTGGKVIRRGCDATAAPMPREGVIRPCADPRPADCLWVACDRARIPTPRLPRLRRWRPRASRLRAESWVGSSGWRRFERRSPPLPEPRAMPRDASSHAGGRRGIRPLRREAAPTGPSGLAAIDATSECDNLRMPLAQSRLERYPS
jgi:hypothetical protein